MSIRKNSAVKSQQNKYSYKLDVIVCPCLLFTNDKAFYSIRLKIFRPDENDRIVSSCGICPCQKRR